MTHSSPAAHAARAAAAVAPCLSLELAARWARWIRCPLLANDQRVLLAATPVTTSDEAAPVTGLLVTILGR